MVEASASWCWLPCTSQSLYTPVTRSNTGGSRPCHTHTLRHRRHVCQKPSHRKSRLPSESQMTFQVSHIGFPSIPPLHNHHKYHITHIFLQRLFCFFSQHQSEFQRNIIPHVSSHTCYPTLERQCPLASSEAPA